MADKVPAVISISGKFELFNDCWRPRVIAEANGQHLKLARLRGEFVWHHHDAEDEIFLVVKGELTIRFRGGNAHLHEGELLVVPRGVEHLPVATGEVQVLLLEPASTVNTGTLRNERTVDPEWI
jgi:mannose-6-phosphate isomerase-like protein (cupin superfamily)